MHALRLALLAMLGFAPPAQAGPHEPPAKDRPAEPKPPALEPIEGGDPLPETIRLDWEGDLAAKMVEGAHRFLDQKIASSRERRDQKWRDVTPEELGEKRDRFRLMIGLRDEPANAPTFEFYREAQDPIPGVPDSVRWPAFADVTGVGRLFKTPFAPVADIILLTDQKGKGYEGLVSRLAGRKFRVLVPFIIPRDHTSRGLPTREWLYRPAFEFGRHLIGYEVQKILAAAEALKATHGDKRPIGIIGTDGDFGMLALFAAAAAEPGTFDTSLCGGFFRPLEDNWRGPADHNLFGLLEEFGAAEIAALTSGKLVLHDCPSPKIEIPSGGKAKPTVPGDPPSKDSIKAEFERYAKLRPENRIPLLSSEDIYDPVALDVFAAALIGKPDPGPPGNPGPSPIGSIGAPFSETLIASQIHELDRHTQSLLGPSRKIRAEFMNDLDTSSPEAFAKSQKPYRRLFAKGVIGKFDDERIFANPHTRAYQKGPHTTSYEVVLKVFPDLFAYGILTLPDDLEEGEKRPVVVCQHGLEGRPQDVVGESKFAAYKAFATRLAERGFITFAPQNLYTGKDRFRLLQFKANSIGKTLFSLMVPQHQQIVDWLGSLGFVDKKRIAFYGLSYGGKSAMRIPPLVPKYCLSICSADFNEWVWKNTATDSNYSYVDKGEYEIFEWNLGNTFNYAEMAALIAPRPFMVERGHFDGVAPDDMVAFEFAKVRHLYQAKLGIGERAEIEWFPGPHTINGKGTYEFLHRHLDFSPTREDPGAAIGAPDPGGVMGIPVPDRPGMILSPHAPDAGLVDVRGLEAGTKIRCPYSGKVIIIP